MVKRFWRAETGIFLAFWFGLLVSGRSKLFNDPGTLWHIAVGQRILSSGEFLYTDPYSFTCQGKPWIAQQWLGECSMGVLDWIGGLDTLLLATVTLLAGLYAWIAHRLIKGGVGWPLAILITSFALLGTSYHLHARPHILNLVFLGWTFAWLCDFEAGRRSLRSLFWLVPVYLVWTNIHGGMVGGLGTMGLAVAGWCFYRLIGKETPLTSWRQALGLALLVLACALTTFVNPYGTELPRVWFALMGSPILPQLIIEHAPLLQSPRSGTVVLLLGGVYLAALLGTLPRWPRVTWLLPLVWLYLAWTRIRHGPLFAVTMGVALADMYPHIRWVAWLSRRGSQVFRIRPPAWSMGPGRFAWRPAVLPAVLVVTALLLQIAAVPVPVLGHGWAKLNPDRWPLQLLPELQQYERDHSEGTPVFNEMLYGGFLIYYTPGLRVFIDDRCELYGDEKLLEVVRAADSDPAQVDRWAQQYGFDLALTEPDSEFDRYLSGARGWVVQHQTKAANLYRRISRQ
jgi:hypothetical protein